MPFSFPSPRKSKLDLREAPGSPTAPPDCRAFRTRRGNEVGASEMASIPPARVFFQRRTSARSGLSRYERRSRPARRAACVTHRVSPLQPCDIAEPGTWRAWPGQSPVMRIGLLKPEAGGINPANCTPNRIRPPPALPPDSKIATWIRLQRDEKGRPRRELRRLCMSCCGVSAACPSMSVSSTRSS